MNEIRRERSLQRFQSRIQPDIAYCATCQPYEGGEPVWIFGDRVNLESLFDDNKVPEELRDALASDLACKGCGAGLSRYDDIGLKTEIELEADRRWEKWHKTYEPKVEDFRKFMENFPYLGVNHSVGRKLCSLIAEFPKTHIKNEIWFRARKVAHAGRLASKDLLPPKFPEAEGRFNHYGQSAFYLAESPKAALFEALEDSEYFAWIQRFRIFNISDILDLTWSPWMAESADIPILALGLINGEHRFASPNRGSVWKPEYFVPRFIADCAKLKGFRGIVFNSPRHFEKNLVLFDWPVKNVRSLGKPCLKERPNEEIVPGTNGTRKQSNRFPRYQAP